MHQKNLSLVFYTRLIQHQQKANPNAGMSLIEILVVVALTALLAALAAPAVTFGNHPLRDSSNRIAASVKWARARAMAETSAVRIRQRNNRSRTQFVMERATQCSDTTWTNITDRVQKDGGWVYEDLSLDSPVRLIRADVDGTRLRPPTGWTLCFNSRGIADQTVELTFRDNDTRERRTMTIFRGGTVDLGAIN